MKWLLIGYVVLLWTVAIVVTALDDDAHDHWKDGW